MVRYKVKEGEALRNTENLRKELTPLSSVACGAIPPSYGRGLWHYAMQHWRHKRKSRNAGSFLRKELPDRAEDRSEKI